MKNDSQSDFYIEDLKTVFTETYHIARGFCCGSKCRHCPYWPKYQKGNTNLRKKDNLDKNK